MRYKNGILKSSMRPASIGLFMLLVAYFALGVRPWRAFAQADAGYTKIGTVTSPTTTFVDSSIQDGLLYEYEVTAFLTASNATKETTPSSDGVQVVPNTGTHTATITWIASVVDATHSAPTGYNVYRQQVFSPNPPGAVSVTVN